METIAVTGIVLSAMQVQEADRRLVLLTKEQGRITVFARGASRPRSALVGVTRPFVTGEFELRPGRDAYTLLSARPREYFDELSKDYDRMTFGLYFLELAAYFSVENVEGLELLNLVFLALKALEKGKMPVPLIRMVYEYRLFVISGEYPQVFQCAVTGKPLAEGYFSLARREALCNECAGGEPGLIRLDVSAMYTLQYILTAPLQKLFGFAVSAAVYEVLSGLLAAWKKRFLAREFRTEAFLPELAFPRDGEKAPD